MFEFIYENGTRFTARLKSVTVTKNGGLGGIYTVAWENGDDRLLRLKIDDLIAIVEHKADELGD